MLLKCRGPELEALLVGFFELIHNIYFSCEEVFIRQVKVWNTPGLVSPRKPPSSSMEGGVCHVCWGPPCRRPSCPCTEVERERGRCLSGCASSSPPGTVEEPGLGRALAWHGVRDRCRGALRLALEVELEDRARLEFRLPVCLLLALGLYPQAPYFHQIKFCHGLSKMESKIIGLFFTEPRHTFY